MLFLNLGLDTDVAAKHKSSNPARTKGNFLTQMPFTSTFCYAWFMGPLFILFASIPPQSHFLALLLDGVYEGICHLFLYKYRKTKQNGISETLKPIYSNPNDLMDRNLRFQGDINVCKAKWEDSVVFGIQQLAKSIFVPLYDSNSEILPTLGLVLLKLNQ